MSLPVITPFVTSEELSPHEYFYRSVTKDDIHIEVFHKPFPEQALVFTCLKCFENTVGKGEIAHNEQFLLSHSVF